MTIKTAITDEQFAENFKKQVSDDKKANGYTGNIKEDGSFRFRNPSVADSVIKGDIVHNEDGTCTVEYVHTKPTGDKIFWGIFIALTAFFTLALISDFPLYSLLAFIIMIFGIGCMLIKSRRKEKLLDDKIQNIVDGVINDEPEYKEVKEDEFATEETHADTTAEVTEETTNEITEAVTEAEKEDK